MSYTYRHKSGLGISWSELFNAVPGVALYNALTKDDVDPQGQSVGVPAAASGPKNAGAPTTKGPPGVPPPAPSEIPWTGILVGGAAAATAYYFLIARKPRR